jgi:hypothetical protein
MKNVSEVDSGCTIRWSGLAVLLGVAMFAATVLTLQFLQPGYSPKHQLMSELAMGRFGYLMIVSFIGLAVSFLGILISVGIGGGSVGLQMALAATVASLLAAGIFPLGSALTLHIASIALAFILSELAIYLYPTGAGKFAPAAPKPVSWPIAGAVAITITLGQSTLPMGVTQRLAAGFPLGWPLVVGWRLARS